MTFIEQLQANWEQSKFVCVGLDPEPSKIPKCVTDKYELPYAMLVFNQEIIRQTKDFACAFKPNMAFYESFGDNGIAVLAQTIGYINHVAPSVPVILDAKRGDIGNTNGHYATMAFDMLKADAITVHPYLGQEALAPFLERKEKGIIVLCKTSNPGSGELQNLTVVTDLHKDGQMPFYKYVAMLTTKDWNKNGNCALVVGATYPKELAEVRQIVGDMPILIPGIGRQGGNLEDTIKAGRVPGGCGVIISITSSIIFASNGDDYGEAARREVQRYNNEIHQHLEEA